MNWIILINIEPIHRCFTIQNCQILNSLIKITLEKLLVRQKINTVRTVGKKYKKGKYFDKHKLLCQQIIFISSDAKTQKSKMTVANESECFFLISHSENVAWYP